MAATKDSAPWPMIKLGDICTITIGKTPARKNESYWGEGFPWLSIKDMNQGRYLSETSEKITQAAVNETNPRLCESGTVVFSFKLSIGKVGITTVPMYTNEAIAAFVPKERADLDRNFLYHALRWTGRNAGGADAVMGKTLNKKTLSGLEIPLPPLDEQRRIAEILDNSSRNLDRIRKLLDLLSLVTDAYRSDIAGATRKPVKEVLRIRSGTVQPTDEANLDLLHVAPNNLASGSDFLFGVRTAAEDGVTSNKYKFEEGDILYSKIRPYLNKVCRAPFGGICSADMYALVPNQPELGPWIVSELRSPRFLAYAERASGRASIPKINRKSLLGFEIEIPSEAVLAEFNTLDAKVEKLRNDVMRKFRISDELHKSLSTRAFQGEL
ncbi:restriction endonuclease subunit S [Corynebacterium cystitidis]|uniref:restriction endonuclease subunit S n=1 Tax=Corynebacterium cystitidis TaxID=35757 RepID=UPI00211E0ED7|nr:restriction endonuclease subunit S [Corynebacterium cystitidis]